MQCSNTCFGAPAWSDIDGNIPAEHGLIPGERGAQCTPCFGQLLMMLGHYGWIRSFDKIDSAHSHRHQGDIYLKVSDIRAGEFLTPGCTVAFYLYADKHGLGAEDCRLATEPPCSSFADDVEPSSGAQDYHWSEATRSCDWPHLEHSHQLNHWSSSGSWNQDLETDGLSRSNRPWQPSWKKASMKGSAFGTMMASDNSAFGAASSWDHGRGSSDSDGDCASWKCSTNSTSAGDSSDSEAESPSSLSAQHLQGQLQLLGISAPPGLEPPDAFGLTM